MKPEEKEQEEALRREKLLEFHKPKPPENKNKNKNKNKNEKEPSPHAPLIPCIKCGKTHRKGAKCKL